MQIIQYTAFAISITALVISIAALRNTLKRKDS